MVYSTIRVHEGGKGKGPSSQWKRKGQSHQSLQSLQLLPQTGGAKEKARAAADLWGAQGFHGGMVKSIGPDYVELQVDNLRCL